MKFISLLLAIIHVSYYFALPISDTNIENFVNNLRNYDIVISDVLEYNITDFEGIIDEKTKYVFSILIFISTFKYSLF